MTSVASPAPERGARAKRILVVAEKTLYRAGVAAIVEQMDLEGIATPATDDALLEAFEDRHLSAAIVVSDDEPRMLPLLAQIRNLRPCLPLILAAAAQHACLLAESLRCGVRAFVDLGCTPSEIRAALAAIDAGGVYLGLSAVELFMRDSTAALDSRSNTRLSPRQREVLAMVGQGMSTAEIAGALGVSPRTIDSHRLAVSKRLGLRSVADVIRYAIREGLVPD